MLPKKKGGASHLTATRLDLIGGLTELATDSDVTTFFFGKHVTITSPVKRQLARDTKSRVPPAGEGAHCSLDKIRDQVMAVT